MWRRPEFVLLGDSLTQFSFGSGGWGARLADTYSRYADVTLRGFSGYTSRWIQHVLPALFPAARVDAAPALVTVFLGANDAALPAPLFKQPPDASRQHVPLHEYADNMRAIVDAIRASGARRVLLITPPPLVEEKWKQHCVQTYGVPVDAQSNRNFETTAAYAATCVRVAGEVGAPVVDLQRAFLGVDGWERLLPDGLHLSAEGQAVVYDAVSSAIVREWPELRPTYFGDTATDKMPIDFPDHKEIDPADPAAAFREALKRAQA